MIAGYYKNSFIATTCCIRDFCEEKVICFVVTIRSTRQNEVACEEDNVWPPMPYANRL